MSLVRTSISDSSTRGSTRASSATSPRGRALQTDQQLTIAAIAQLLSDFDIAVGSRQERAGAHVWDLDLDGDWSTDTTLIYKPSKQIGGEFVLDNVWQYWDATNGQFYSTTNYGSGESALKNDGTLYPLSTIKAWYPLAQIQVLGVMIGDDLINSTVLVDGISVGSSTYDFEKVVPTDDEVVSVPKTIQECKKYGWETLFTTEGEDFRNQGQCVGYIVSSKAKVKQ